MIKMMTYTTSLLRINPTKVSEGYFLYQNRLNRDYSKMKFSLKHIFSVLGKILWLSL